MIITVYDICCVFQEKMFRFYKKNSRLAYTFSAVELLNIEISIPNQARKIQNFSVYMSIRICHFGPKLHIFILGFSFKRQNSRDNVEQYFFLFRVVCFDSRLQLGQ